MRDSQHGGQGERDTSGVSVLAQTVLARLLGRTVGAGRGPKPDLTVALARAVMAADPGELQALRIELRRQRVSEAELVDCYFPAVARHLGCDWLEDRAGFAQVTIGLARMQAVLHDVSRGWISNAAARSGGATVLLALPAGEQHCFGALLMMGQLRRRGVSVQLQLQATPPQMRALARDLGFDCVMISVGCIEKVDACRALVDALRTGAGRSVRIVVGGAVLEQDIDVQGLTGADIVTCDPDVALAGLALRTQPKQRDAG